MMVDLPVDDAKCSIIGSRFGLGLLAAFAHVDMVCIVNNIMDKSVMVCR